MQALDAFLGWCERADVRAARRGCAARRPQPAARRVDAAPMPASYTANGATRAGVAHRRACFETAVYLDALRPSRGWPILADALAAPSHDGDAAPLLSARRPVPRPQPRRHVHLAGRGQLGDQLRRPSRAEGAARAAQRARRRRRASRPQLPPWGGDWARRRLRRACRSRPRATSSATCRCTGAPPILVDRHHRRPRHALRRRARRWWRASPGSVAAHLREHRAHRVRHAAAARASTTSSNAVPRRRRDAARPAPAAQPSRRPPRASPPSRLTERVVGDVFERAGARRTGCGCGRRGSRRPRGRASPTRGRSPPAPARRGRAVAASSRSSKRRPNASSPKPQCSPGVSHTSSAHRPSARTSSSAPSRERHVVVVRRATTPPSTDGSSATQSDA